MVKITRSHTWEELHRDLLYNWIERLSKLDEHYIDDSTTRLLSYTVALAVSILLFVISVSLMLVFYRRVDPRYPTLNPQPFTVRELFGILEPLHGKAVNEEPGSSADRTGIPVKSAVNVTQRSLKSADVMTGQGGDSYEEIVAVETKITQSTPVARSIERIDNVGRQMPKATATPEVVIKSTKTENRKSAKTTSTKTGIIQMNKEKMITESVTNDGTKVATALSMKELRLKSRSEKLTAKDMDGDDAKATNRFHMGR